MPNIGVTVSFISLLSLFSSWSLLVFLVMPKLERNAFWTQFTDRYLKFGMHKINLFCIVLGANKFKISLRKPTKQWKLILFLITWWKLILFLITWKKQCAWLRKFWEWIKRHRHWCPVIWLCTWSRSQDNDRDCLN